MKMQTLTVAGVATVTALAAGMATADSITLDLAGVNSNDNFGSPNNDASLIALGDVTITGIGWDNVVGNGDDTGVTWGNEMRMAVVDSGNLEGVFVTFFPAEGSATAGGVWGPAIKRWHHRPGCTGSRIQHGLRFTPGRVLRVLQRR